MASIRTTTKPKRCLREERLSEAAQVWVPQVRRHRPPAPPPAQDPRLLLRAVNAYVRDGFLPAIVAAIRGADPDITLQAICDRLEAMRERTPRGRTHWQPSSVRMLLERAERLGLI